LAYTSNILLT